MERTQKVALKIILGEDYISYENSLKTTGLERLTARRTKLSLNFAKKCVKNRYTSWMFPLKEQKVETRAPERFQVTKARTDRLAKSAIPYMQKLLNTNWK